MKILNLAVLAVVVLSAALVRPACAETFEYEGGLRAQGKSYDGEKFDRQFDVAVQFDAAAPQPFTAEVSKGIETAVDEQGVFGMPSHRSFCFTKADYDLGTVYISVTDKKYGVTYGQALPWKGHSNAASNCASADLSGRPVVGQVLAKINTTEGRLTLFVEPQFLASEALAMHAVATRVAGNTFQRTAFTAGPQTPLVWTFEEKPGWIVSGVQTLDKK